eukprot:2237583-Pleurochrysis_carterae.AAC.1
MQDLSKKRVDTTKNETGGQAPVAAAPCKFPRPRAAMTCRTTLCPQIALTHMSRTTSKTLRSVASQSGGARGSTQQFP